VFADTPVERRLIDSWIARSGREDVEVVEAGGAALQSELVAAGQELHILPVGVTWLPSDGSATGRLAGLVSAHGPTAWRRLTQDRVARTRPTLHRVLEGQPATVEELRGRFKMGSAADGSEAFAAFVRRQGLLALERARRAVVGQQYKTARLAPEEVLASSRFHERAKQLADELGRSEQSVLEEAAAYLKEMEAMHNAFAIDAWQSFTKRVISSYSIESDERQIENLRRLGGEHALVYLPSHRSYLDPFILRSVFHRHGLAPNYVLGGINTGFWPVGPIARRNGIVFIRRSYQDKPVYSATLREYIGYLVRKRFNLEWYIEGGRSRTGKLRPPRYGILAYVIGAVRNGAADDVLLVPTSLVYEHLPELSAIAEENLGGEKRPEGVRWLIGYVRAQRRAPSTVHVRFGEPFSLREALASVTQSANGQATSQDLSVEKVAFEVMHRINRATPVTPVALVTLALLGTGDRALTLAEIRRILTPLLGYVRRRGIPMTDETILEDPEGLRGTLTALARLGVVTAYLDGPEHAWGVPAERQHEAAFYRNSIVHFFVNRAIVELIGLALVEEDFGDTASATWAQALRLRDVLKFEFFFPSKADFAAEIREEAAMVDSDWESLASDPGRIRDKLASSDLFLAHRVVGPYCQAYVVVADRLAARDPALPINEKEFTRECLGAARQYRAQQRIWSSEALSKELFQNGLTLAANRGLLDPDGEELAERRRAFAEEMRVLLRRVRTIRDLALLDLDAAMGWARR
jgi:glycerol-3-phosphate O-acyltransferase